MGKVLAPWDGFMFADPISQMQVERRDGPRYVEAVREGRRLQERAARKHFRGTGVLEVDCYRSLSDWAPGQANREHLGGIPVGWITRPSDGLESRP